MKKKLLLGVSALILIATALTLYSSNGKIESNLLLKNIEALAQTENLPGKVCYYKGSKTLTNHIPCTADYPSIGKCGERIEGYYSDDKAQCRE